MGVAPTGDYTQIRISIAVVFSKSVATALYGAFAYSAFSIECSLIAIGIQIRRGVCTKACVRNLNIVDPQFARFTGRSNTNFESI